MKGLESAIDRSFTRLSRLSEHQAQVLAGILYGVGGLLLPLILWRLSPSPKTILFMATANFLFVSLAFFVIVAWLGGLIRTGHRRLLVEWTTNLRLLNSTEFEWFVGEVFRREGWKVSERGHPDRADGNIDLELTKDRQRMLVQCKRWTSWQVGVDEVRGFAGTLLREGLSGQDGVFVTLSDFTTDARTDAARLEMHLVDGPELYARAEAVRRREPCPVCGSGMVLDHSPRGWWLRCIARGCSGKQDLGKDAEAAILLLSVASNGESREL